jgi:hypothetical protein
LHGLTPDIAFMATKPLKNSAVSASKSQKGPRNGIAGAGDLFLV